MFNASSWSAKADHPRLTRVRQRRGWSAFADHDDGCGACPRHRSSPPPPPARPTSPSGGCRHSTRQPTSISANWSSDFGKSKQHRRRIRRGARERHQRPPRRLVPGQRAAGRLHAGESARAILHRQQPRSAARRRARRHAQGARRHLRKSATRSAAPATLSQALPLEVDVSPMFTRKDLLDEIGTRDPAEHGTSCAKTRRLIQAKHPGRSPASA